MRGMAVDRVEHPSRAGIFRFVVRSFVCLSALAVFPALEFRGGAFYQFAGRAVVFACGRTAVVGHGVGDGNSLRGDDGHADDSSSRRF